jgi:glucose-1-phosphate thymidylyltransferase
MEGIVLIREAGIHHYLIKTVGAPEEVQRVTTLDGRKPVIPEIEEKPENPRSNYAVIRVEMYDPGVLDMIRRIKPSARNELEINSADNEYRQQHNLTHGVVEDERMNASDFGLYYANDLLFSIDYTVQLGGDHADTL